ncbi:MULTISPECIES: methionine ABC transporter permease [Paenibacillus]|uniref:ABC transporter permease n=2 Tax=Paenibacillus TaxID=44249 RepID=A0A165QI91_9BACL|nr:MULTISPECIES: methionine ABC transporter permease [Paenibacillus]KZE75112.1 metal ABC transporter permease [Paenibacillus elgii]MBU7314072.1 ABC transporter permease [Paenibacillus oleatilyticus]MCM3270952.1 ABC transporter permease [Paenibacillus elgii]NEN86052.1 ABC transporter permease [Paenibacillus elgii]PUA35723.1 ABC transporter permease [Paenibacillus elgii]
MDELLNLDWGAIGEATYDTLTMLGLSMVFTVLIGLPLGIILFVTSRGQLLGQPVVYALLSLVVNVLRSVPFVILMIMLIPFTRLVVGTSLGVSGSIPPLVIAAAPFFARLVETSLREVDRGVVEAAQSMGATYWQIVSRVMLPEARPGLIAGATITAVTLVSYTAMSGVIGGGGLGDLAIRFGYQRFQTLVMIVTVLLLLVLVQILQSLGDRLVRKFQRK